MALFPTNQPILTLEDLLSAPTLRQYYPYFLQAGCDDVDTIVLMSEQEWMTMFEAIERTMNDEHVRVQQPLIHASGDNENDDGKKMIFGESTSQLRPSSIKLPHRLLIISLLRTEKERRSAIPHRSSGRSLDHVIQMPYNTKKPWDSRDEFPNNNESSTVHRPMLQSMTVKPFNMVMSDNDDVSDFAANNAIFLEGCRGLYSKHWCLFFGSSMIFLLIGVLLFVLRSSISYPHNNSNASIQTQGGWNAVFVISIIGFAIAGISSIFCMVSFFRIKENRCGSALAACSTCGADFASCCRSFFSDCELPSCFACPSCDCSVCHDCDLCGSCSEKCCPSLSCPNCSGCLPADCGCGECATCCDECHLPVCECPDCTGLVSCCTTFFKLLTCQCKIQVA